MSGPRRRLGVYLAVVVASRAGAAPGRVALRLPWLPDGEATAWARVAAPLAGPGRGAFLPPEPGSQVLVAFEAGDPARPIVLGALWSRTDRIPSSARPGALVLASRSGQAVVLDDAGGGRVVLRDGSGASEITFEQASGRVAIRAARRLELRAPRGVVRLRGRRVTLAAGGRLALTGRTITTQADRDLTVTSAAALALRAGRIELGGAQPGGRRRR